MSTVLFALYCTLQCTYGYWVARTIPSMPRVMYVGAAGHYNGTIYLFGGFQWRTQLIRYEIDQAIFIDDGTKGINVSTYGYGQFYTQMDEIMYAISPIGDRINVYNLRTSNFSSDNSYPSIPINVQQRGCLASDSVTKTLFITGGSLSAINALQILDLESYSFIVSDQNMSDNRRDHACIVDEIDGYLYAIGGSDSRGGGVNSIERISSDYVTNASWEFFNGILSAKGGTLRCIMYKHKIYIVSGGSIGVYVNIIDIEAGIVLRSDDLLFYAQYGAAAIIVKNRIYAFGGFGSGLGYLSMWQYYDFDVSQDPTAFPSQSPSTTIAPTGEPSMLPTEAPITSIPSEFPSISPMTITTELTKTPSNNPSITPSSSPITLKPTAEVALVVYIL